MCINFDKNGKYSRQENLAKTYVCVWITAEKSTNRWKMDIYHAVEHLSFSPSAQKPYWECHGRKKINEKLLVHNFNSVVQKKLRCLHRDVSRTCCIASQWNEWSAFVSCDVWLCSSCHWRDDSLAIKPPNDSWSSLLRSPCGIKP